MADLHVIEHAPTRTLIRVSEYGFQLIRDGRVAFKDSCHGQVSLARNGVLAWQTSYSHMESLVLAEPLTQKPRRWGNAKLLHPDGTHLLDFRYVAEEDHARHPEDELYVMDLDGANERTL